MSDEDGVEGRVGVARAEQRVGEEPVAVRVVGALVAVAPRSAPTAAPAARATRGRRHRPPTTSPAPTPRAPLASSPCLQAFTTCLPSPAVKRWTRRRLAYDARRLIENSCTREAKEHWFLEHHPKRSAAGVRVHADFVFRCMALVAGFRAHKTKAEEPERRGQELGITRYRRQLYVRNRDKVVGFIGTRFGIFRSYEFALLAGLTVRDRAALGESTQPVLARYGVVAPAPPGHTS